MSAAALLIAVPAAFSGAQSVTSDGPLTDISISPDLNCAVNHTGDASGEWYDNTACGTFVAVGGTLYGPADVPAGGNLRSPGPYEQYGFSTDPQTGEPDNQTTTGTGAEDDPFVIRTVVTLGESGITLTETDTYVAGQESYRTAVRLDNTESEAQSAIIYRGGDCFLQNSDQGRGRVDNDVAPTCVAPPDNPDDPNDNPDRIEQMYPLTEGSHYIEGIYADMWTAIGSMQPLPDTCVCDGSTVDNGLALSWSQRLAAGGNTSISALTLFSPLGTTPLTFSKTADNASADAGTNDGYTITVTNNGPRRQVLDSITDTLPVGFTYDPGSSSGATTNDPEVSGQDVTWSGPFVVPSADDGPGTLTLHFGVVVSDTPGTYTNSVTGAGKGVTVVPATDVAPITVTGSRGPIAVDDGPYQTPFDTPLHVDAAGGVLGNDTNPSESPLHVDTTSVDAPAHGTVTVQPDGSFDYSPAAGFSGTDSFTYRDFADGAGFSNFATVTIDVQADQPPTVVDDSYSTLEDHQLTVAAPGVLSNDSDPEKHSLRASVAVAPRHGELRLQPTGRFVYTPDPDFNGTDTFTYTASDGTTVSAPATVTITVEPVDDPIVAHDDFYTTSRDNTLHVDAPGVLANDDNVDGRAQAVPAGPGPQHGTVTLDPDGSFVYTPAAGYVGNDTFGYAAGDGSSATVTISVVRGEDRPPTATDDNYVTYEDNTLTVDAPGVLENDVDPDNDTLMATVVGAPSHGGLVLQGDGSFVYTPANDYNGPDSFTYEASDGELSAVATVNIDVRGLPDRPIAVPDAYSTAQDTTLTVAAPGVLGNDTDVDGDQPQARFEPGSGPAHGTVQLSADGSFTYVPDAGYTGPDSFRYSAVSGEETSDPTTVSLTVLPVNRRPIASPDHYRTPRDVRLRVAVPGVLGNDIDLNGLDAALVGGPSHGSLHLHGDGSFTYTPVRGFLGTDSFRYRATDGLLDSTPSLVTITVFGSSPTPPPTTTPPTPPTTTPPTSSPVTPPTPAPSGAGPTSVPSPLPSGEPTVPGSVAPTTAPSSTPLPSPATSPSASSPVITRVPNGLKLSSPSIDPGGSVTAAGSGCGAGETVTLSIDGRGVGRGTADDNGKFDIAVRPPQLEIGKHTIVATCGNRQLSSPVAFVSVTGTSSAATARALTVGSVFAFFLLFLGLALRRPNAGK